MKKSFTTINSLLLIVGMNWSAVSLIAGTDAYFNDTEISENNILTAGSLDFHLSGDSFSVYDFDGTMEIRNIEVVNDGSLDFQHTLSVETSGSFCDDLNIMITDPKTQLQYNGSLTNFISTKVDIQGVWNFEISYQQTAPLPADSSCFFNFVFDGWQDNVLNYGDSGFSDTEIISNVISTELNASPPISDLPTPDDPNSKPNPNCGPTDHLVINEVYIDGTDDWIELYNPTDGDIDLYSGDYRLERKTATGTATSLFMEIGNLVYGSYPGGTIIPAYGFYLIVRDDAIDDLKNKADAIGVHNQFTLTDDNSIYLATGPISDSPDDMTDSELIDLVGYGTATSFETAPYLNNPLNNQSIERGLTGYDSNDNSKDFIVKTNPTPTNSSGDGMPEIVINEFLASGNVYDDFIEIYNGSDNDLEAGWWVRIENEDASIFVEAYNLPRLETGEFEVVYTTTYFATDVLLGDGIITIYDKDNNEIDKISYYGATTIDSSFARIPDGSPNWIDPIPTPKTTNEIYENLIIAGLDNLIGENGGLTPPGPNPEINLPPVAISSAPAPAIPEPIIEPTTDEDEEEENTDTDDTADDTDKDTDTDTDDIDDTDTTGDDDIADDGDSDTTDDTTDGDDTDDTGTGTDTDSADGDTADGGDTTSDADADADADDGDSGETDTGDEEETGEETKPEVDGGDGETEPAPEDGTGGDEESNE